MRRDRKPKIDARPPANHYAESGQRIAEISSDAGGCLLSLQVRDGRLHVEPFRIDSTVDVITPANASSIMSTGERESLRSIVAYLTQHEGIDYEEMCEAGEDTSRHVWHDVEALCRYLDRNRSGDRA